MNHNEVLIRDRAGCMWLLGLGFAGGGALVTAMLLSNAQGRPSGWLLLLTAVIALAHLTTGTWLVVKHPNIRTELCMGCRMLRIVRRWPWFSRARELHVDQIRYAVVREERDSDNDPIYCLELLLGTGERLVLQSVALHTREPIDAALMRLAEWSSGRVLVRSEHGEPRSPERG
jgi:hypothetical protein